MIALGCAACSGGGSSSSSSSGAGGATTSTTTGQGDTTSASSGGQGGLGQHACDACDGTCVDLANDSKNCGRCGHGCQASAPACSHGACVAPTCNVVPPCPLDHACCGDACCPSYALCCLDEHGAPGCVAAPDGGAIACPTSCCE